MTTSVDRGLVDLDTATEALIEKIKSAVTELATRRGPLGLFALLEREDTPGRWDIVASAPWLAPGRDGILIIAQQITGHLAPEEAIRIARIVPLPPNSNFVQSLQARYEPKPGNNLGAFLLNGAEITQGYILASRPTPSFQADTDAATAGIMRP